MYIFIEGVLVFLILFYIWVCNDPSNIALNLILYRYYLIELFYVVIILLKYEVNIL